MQQSLKDGCLFLSRVTLSVITLCVSHEAPAVCSLLPFSVGWMQPAGIDEPSWSQSWKQDAEEVQ